MRRRLPGEVDGAAIGPDGEIAPIDPQHPR
jgi:hypothetical protein